MVDFFAEQNPNTFSLLFLHLILIWRFTSPYMDFIWWHLLVLIQYKQFLGQPFTIYGLICSVKVIINIEEGVKI